MLFTLNADIRPADGSRRRSLSPRHLPAPSIPSSLPMDNRAMNETKPERR
jgi:hypothetical protein